MLETSKTTGLQPTIGLDACGKDVCGRLEHFLDGRGQLAVGLHADRPDHLRPNAHRYAGLGDQSRDGGDEVRGLRHVLEKLRDAGGYHPPDHADAGGEPVDHLVVPACSLAAKPTVDEQVHARQRVALAQVVHQASHASATVAAAAQRGKAS